MRMLHRLSVDMKTGEEDTAFVVSLVLVLSLLVEAIDEKTVQGLKLERKHGRY